MGIVRGGQRGSARTGAVRGRVFQVRFSPILFYLYNYILWIFHKRTKMSFHHPQPSPNNPRECDDTTAMRPSYDFSSIGRLALNHDHEEHIGIHSIINAAVLEQPLSPSITTTTIVAAPEPAAKSNTTRPRPPSGLNNYQRVIHSLQRRHTTRLHARNRHIRIAIPLHVGGSGHLVTKESDREKEQDKGKGRENAPHQPIPPWLLEAGVHTHHLFRIRRSEIKIYTRRCGPLRRLRLRAMRRRHRLRGRHRGSICGLYHNCNDSLQFWTRNDTNWIRS